MTCVIENARFDEALIVILNSIRGAKNLLTYHNEGGKVVIALKDGASNPDSSVPSATANGGWDLDLAGTTLDEALANLFRTRGINCIYTGTLNGKVPVVIKRHFDTEEAAVVAVI